MNSLNNYFYLRPTNPRIVDSKTAILIPARDEEDNIKNLLSDLSEQILLSDYSVTVLDDNTNKQASTGLTPQWVLQFGSYENAKDYVNSLIPSLIKHASLIIDSGNGIQVFYRLAPALDISSQEAKEKYEIVNRAVAKRWHADSTQDCSRILRIPGTLN